MEEAQEPKSKAETTPRDNVGRFIPEQKPAPAGKKEHPAEETKKIKEDPAPEPELELELELELEPAPEPEPEPEPVPEPAPAPEPAVMPLEDGQIADSKTTVSVAALVYSARKKNSVSVAVLQDRLAALNYTGVRSDFRGWFYDGTKRSIEAWQKDNGLEVTGDLSRKTDVDSLFSGTDVELI